MTTEMKYYERTMRLNLSMADMLAIFNIALSIRVCGNFGEKERLVSTLFRYILFSIY